MLNAFDVSSFLLLVFGLVNPLNTQIFSVIPLKIELDKLINFLTAIFAFFQSLMEVFGSAEVKLINGPLSLYLDSYDIYAFLVRYLIGILRVLYPRSAICSKKI